MSVPALTTGAKQLQEIIQSGLKVGGIYQMGYDQCYLITNDKWREAAGGIPQAGLAIATNHQADGYTYKDGDHALLLRVEDYQRLPIEEDLSHTRAKAMRDMVEGKKDQHGNVQLLSADDVLDVVMRNEIHFSGLKARVLGMIYVNKDDELRFTQTLDDFVARSHYYVYKPGPTGQEILFNTHNELPTNDDKIHPFKIGVLRESQREKKPNSVPIKVNAWDFISQKTAVLGMTRMGKSNTLKQIAAATLQLSLNIQHENLDRVKNDEEPLQPIGQLIFDPMGEYAFPNEQDQDARLAAIGENVVIFSNSEKDVAPAVKHPLKWNFHDRDAWEETGPQVISILDRHKAGYTDYIKEMDFTDSDEYELKNKAAKRWGILRAAMQKAELRAPHNSPIEVVAKGSVRKTLEDYLKSKYEDDTEIPDWAEDLEKFSGGKCKMPPEKAVKFYTAIGEARKIDKFRKSMADWLNDETNALLDFFMGKGLLGYRLLAGLKKFHDANARTQVQSEIFSQLEAGRLVIVDLSNSEIDAATSVSEGILSALIRTSQDRFTTPGANLPRIQIFIEEAHTLFARSGESSKQHARDAYQRLAKEAAKLKIGLIYATQEITSVDPVILNNTANWIITRFNNKEELNKLGKYEDFKDFEEQIQRIEEIGLARIKTASSPLTIPTQVHLFTKATVDQVIAIEEESPTLDEADKDSDASADGEEE